jgi:hypothetical protein
MKAPQIDARDINKLIKKMEEMVPFYTPEWKFSISEPDAGAALFMSFAEMFTGLINRYNRVPEKNFIAFLNMLGLKLSPAQPSRAPMTFRLSAGAEEPVLVPVGTQITAEVPDSDEPLVFETENNLLVTPATPITAYNVSVQHDKITKIPEALFGDPRVSEKQDCRLFDFSSEANLQEHILFLSNTSLFNTYHSSVFTFRFRNSNRSYQEKEIMQKLANPKLVQWQYWGEIDGVLGWYDFDTWTGDDSELSLVKTRTGWLKELEINEVNSRWIKCTGLAAGIEELKEIAVDNIRFNVNFTAVGSDDGGILPDMLFYNDLPLNLEELYPFGEVFVLYDAFYISSQEVFSKKGAQVTIRFDYEIKDFEYKTEGEKEVKWKLVMKKSDFQKRKLLKITLAKISWEYWNGTGWLKLSVDSDAEEIFINEETPKTIHFQCPADFKESWMNNQLNFWIRARVTKIDNMFAASLFYRTPYIKSISLQYSFEGCNSLLDNCLTYNDIEYLDQTEKCRGLNAVFKPFYSQDNNVPMFYMGFEKPPMGGPISMFFSVIDQKLATDKSGHTFWQYLKDSDGTIEWMPLRVEDNTRDMSQSGTVIFAGPPDFARQQLFGNSLYWVRIINPDGRFDSLTGTLPCPRVDGIYMNTNWAVQQENVRNEQLDPVQGEPNKEYVLLKAPILAEEVWVNEADDLTELEMVRLATEAKTMTESVRDEYGQVIEFWVKWQAKEDFYDSGPADRHYTVDRAIGKIVFGDGRLGKIPSAYKGGSIKVNYKIGGGRKGNVGAFEIRNLISSAAYINEVYNPKPAIGGSDIESIEKALLRGPQLIKHRNRAVTTEDLENLARQSSQIVAKVKCLPNFNSNGERDTGWVTLVIVPVVEGGFGRPSPDLKQKVSNYIAERTVNTLAFSNRLVVIEPVYVEISIYGILIAEQIDIVHSVEKEAVEKLNGFLDPVSGGYDGTGWDIGRLPHISMFYSLLKSINGVNYVERVSMTVNTIIEGKTEEVNLERLKDWPQVLVINGKHKVAAYI